MSKNSVNPFTINLPTLDLHGETIDVSFNLIDDFINEQIVLKNNKALIIHGIGGKLLQTAVRDYLKTHPLIKQTELDIYNDGVTIIYIK